MRTTPFQTTSLFLPALLIGFFFISPDRTLASCGSVPVSGNYTVSASCAFAGTVDGVDAGSGTSNTANIIINSSQTLTVNAGQTVVFGGSITVNGAIAISATGKLQQGPLWMTDANADGYPANTTQISQATQPTNGRRRNLMIPSPYLTSATGGTITTFGPGMTERPAY